MDGNGRWAEEKGQDRLYGQLITAWKACVMLWKVAELGIGYLTLYAFSTGKLGQPGDEVAGLMELLVETIKKKWRLLTKIISGCT